MIITSNTHTVTDYQFVVTADEAAGALVDPFSFGEKIAEQLRAAGVRPADGGGNGKVHAKPGAASQFSIGKRGRKAGKTAKAKRPNLKAGKRAGAGKADSIADSLQPLQCPHCPRKIARKFLRNHITKMHPDQGAPDWTPASAAKSDSL